MKHVVSHWNPEWPKAIFVILSTKDEKGHHTFQAQNYEKLRSRSIHRQEFYIQKLPLSEKPPVLIKSVQKNRP